MRPRPSLGRLRRLSWQDRGLLLEACWWLALARPVVRLVPFRWLATRLGEPMTETPEDVRIASAARIGWAVRAASSVTPWKAPCLAQAIAGQRMLRRRRLPSTIYLGLTKDGAAMAAHAWLRCGSDILTGERERDRDDFTPVASFASSGC